MVTVPDLIKCIDCPAEFEPGHGAKRCPQCRVKRASRGSPSRKSKRLRRDGGRDGRNDELRNVTIWGIDGEGLNRSDGNHEYVYLCAVSTDGQMEELWEGGRRLTSHECLWFLWKLGEPGDIFAWYFSGYDWCHIFRDVGLENLQSLYNASKPLVDVTWYEGFLLKYLKNTVTMARRNGVNAPEKFFTDISRVYGAFQFVDFIDKWDTGTPAERKRIAAMKAKRQDFTECGPEERAYCQLECKHLAEGTRKMWQAMIELNVVPARRRMYSAGSLAKAMFRSYNVHGYSAIDRYAGAGSDSDIADALRRGYFGARVELADPGLHKLLHEYDLNSAYPAVMAGLPCLSHGEWHHAEGGAPAVTPEAALREPTITHVRWDLKPDAPPQHWGPLPWRYPDGIILFPRRGEGWYWRAEVEAAKSYPHFEITEVEHYSWQQTCEHQPFNWVPEIHEKRKKADLEWKEGGHSGKSPTGLVLKITLNSGYGTTADTVTEDPIFASLVWSGMITAGTRALVGRELAAHGTDVVGVSTDAIFTKTKIMRGSPDLGAWGYEGPLRDCLLIQAGIRTSSAGDKNRGITMQAAREVGPDGLTFFQRARKTWQATGYDQPVVYVRRRMVPPRQALRSPDPLSVIGRWATINDAPIKWTSPKRKYLGSSVISGVRGPGWTRPAQHDPGLGVSYPYSKILIAEAFLEDELRREGEQFRP
jgi:hypothetical protein